MNKALGVIQIKRDTLSLNEVSHRLFLVLKMLFLMLLGVFGIGQD
jgi:hypothetical protein